MKRINLTKNENTIYVWDVDVANGVYCKRDGWGDSAVIKHSAGISLIYLKSNTSLNEYRKFQTLKELMSEINDGDYYTIPDNKRITLEKEIGVEDLKDTDHVGFDIKHGVKGHIVYVGDGGYQPVSMRTNEYACNTVYNGGVRHTGLSKCVKFLTINDIELYTFDTRQELYKWLSE